MTEIDRSHIREHTNIRYMKRLKRFEPRVMDHSAIIQAMRCKKKYFFRVVLGFVQADQPQYFGFGSCYHKFREVLERMYMAEKNVVIKASPEFQMTIFGQALQTALKLWEDKKMRDPVVGDKWEFLTRGRLMESCTVAFKNWQREKERGRIEVIAVEQDAIIPLPDGQEIGVKLDQVVRWNGKVWGRDFKTSSKAQDAWFTRTLDPNDQFTRYTYGEQKLCGEDVQGQLIEVLYNAKGTKAEPKKGPTIYQHMATRSQTQLAEWEKEQMFYGKLLDLCRTEDIWPMEPASCPYCEFHSVCQKPGENAQMAKLEAEFVVNPWNFMDRDVDD